MEISGVKYLLDTAPWINAVTLPNVLPRRLVTIQHCQRSAGSSGILPKIKFKEEKIPRTPRTPRPKGS